ncbi:MAG: ADP-forming succinate--CoA ligase subunit beta [Draconibacterium sp.]|nr:ADP-forming succinate--CoA ligase subunit beta [Draconibacterium sp.]
MKIHEYQARDLFRKYGIPVPDGDVCHSVDEVKKKVTDDDKLRVVKAQVHVGGRGKAGGVKLARSKAEVIEHAEQILGMDIKGLTVEKVLIADAVDIEKEYYVGLINDRNTKSVTLMASAEGGVEIEEVAKVSPEKIIKMAIDPTMGLMDWQARKVALQLFTDPKQVRQTAAILVKLYELYVDTDSSLAEINPLVLTPDKKVLAIDGKMNFDDNALFRQKEILAMREVTEDEQKEIEATANGLSYIKLDGNVGCMVNGAGLAMATMDMIQLSGGSPANFLDVGGGANVERISNAFRIMMSDSKVEAVLINIFGGIVRCDKVADGIIEALKTVEVDIPVIVRLDGTNAKEGAESLKNSGMKFDIAINFEDAAKSVAKVVAN